MADHTLGTVRSWNHGLLAVFLLLASKAALGAPVTIPSAFHGRWNPTFAACSPNQEGVKEIRIDHSGFTYYEWSHAPISVVSLGTNAVRIDALLWLPERDLDKPGGKDIIVLRLLAGGQRLSYQVDRERPMFYVRCKTVRRGAN